MFFFFFFSSRRRHTRYIGDWSSDVCSSDLYLNDPTGQQYRARRIVEVTRKRYRIARNPKRALTAARLICNEWLPRSEARRVGKEGRYRRSGEDEKKKKKERDKGERLDKVIE